MWGSCAQGGPVAFRVLVLYLGNLYSLIIALLDKVNSMSTQVSTCLCHLPHSRVAITDSIHSSCPKLKEKTEKLSQCSAKEVEAKTHGQLSGHSGNRTGLLSLPSWCILNYFLESHPEKLSCLADDPRKSNKDSPPTVPAPLVSPHLTQIPCVHLQPPLFRRTPQLVGWAKSDF